MAKHLESDGKNDDNGAAVQPASGFDEVAVAAEKELGIDLGTYTSQMQIVPDLSRKEKDKLTTMTADLLDHEVGNPLREVAIHSLTGESLHELETKDSDEYKTMADFIEASREARRLAENVGEVAITDDGTLVNHDGSNDE